LAPALMRAGYTGPASALYTLYGFTCHQLPQRSYFLFGQKLMYPLDKILSNWPEATDFFEQRAILGDPVFGYKVAIANRCSAKCFAPRLRSICNSTNGSAPKYPQEFFITIAIERLKSSSASMSPLIAHSMRQVSMCPSSSLIVT